MMAVDSNILIYALREESTWNLQARKVLRELAAAPEPWAIPWPCVHEYLAIATHARIFHPPTPLNDALLQMRNWMESPTLVLLHESDGFLGVLEEVLRRSIIQGPMVHDARIVALCLRHGVKKLLTADRDFSRFPQLRTENPLV